MRNILCCEPRQEHQREILISVALSFLPCTSNFSPSHPHPNHPQTPLSLHYTTAHPHSSITSPSQCHLQQFSMASTASSSHLLCNRLLTVRSSGRKTVTLKSPTVPISEVRFLQADGQITLSFHHMQQRMMAIVKVSQLQYQGCHNTNHLQSEIPRHEAPHSSSDLPPPEWSAPEPGSRNLSYFELWHSVLLVS